MAASSKLDWFSFVSMLSGASLAFFGILSIFVSLSYWSPSGFLISLGLLFHGLIELFNRRQLLRKGEASGLKWMIWNQRLLGATITTYLLWQMIHVDSSQILAILNGPNLKMIWEMYPPELRDSIEAMLPQITRLNYLLMIVVVWVGCLLTAKLYARSEARFSTSARGPE